MQYTDEDTSPVDLVVGNSIGFYPEALAHAASRSSSTWDTPDGLADN